MDLGIIHYAFCVMKMSLLKNLCKVKIYRELKSNLYSKENMDALNTECKKYYLSNLDGMRAISIILVLIYHGSWFYLGPESPEHNPYIWHNFLKQGITGVYIFFSISGFLITSRILQEIKVYGNFSGKNFYVKRFFRIFPPFYFFLSILIILKWTSVININWKDIISSATFTRIYFGDTLSWFTAHIWSLCIEEHFYIVLSLFFLFFKLKNIKWITLLSTFVLFAISKWLFMHKGQFESSNIREYFKVFEGMVYMFPAVFFAFITFEKKNLGFRPWHTSILLLLISVCIFIPFSGKTYILPWLISLGVIASCYHPPKFLSSFLSNKILAYIGKISYSLYLWQQLFFTPFNQDTVISTLPFFFKVVLTFGFAVFSYKYIEFYFIKMGKKFSDRPI